jgi:hypothetical protein
MSGGRGRVREGMAEEDDAPWGWIVVLVVCALFIVGVICCVPPSKDRSLFWYFLDCVSGDRYRRNRAMKAEQAEQAERAAAAAAAAAGAGAAEDAAQTSSAAMLPSLSSLSSVRWSAL